MSSVDVVIPCYNYGRYLRQCVESVLQQEGVDVRVLIIDDCSPDDTPEIGQQLAAQDARVEYRRHPQNKGHIATYNEGLLEWAQADYLLLLSADDLLTSGALSRATYLMDAHENVVLAYGRALIIQREDKLPDIRQYLTNDEIRIVKGHTFLEHCCISLENPIPTPTAVVRTNVQKAIGGYRSDLPHTGDMEMWMRFALSGDIGVLRTPQGFYSLHGGNMSHTYRRRGLEDLPERAKAFSDLFDKAQNNSDLKNLRELATNNLAWRAFWSGHLAWESGEIDICHECMQFAQSIAPQIKSTRVWKNQHWKLRLGSRTVNMIRSFMEPFIRTSTAENRQTFESGVDSNNWWGWWPA